MNKIIGVAGKAGSGKDSFASVLLRYGNYTQINFADHLKQICGQVFGLSEFQMNTPEGKIQKFSKPVLFYKPQLDEIVSVIKETHDIENFAFELNQLFDAYGHPTKAKKLYTPREVLQFVGTDVCRVAHVDYFIQVWLKKVNNCTTNVVATDVRFKNERDAVRLGAKNTLLYISRDSDHFDGSVYTHASETNFGEMDEYDVVILNNGTLEDLEQKAKAYL